MKIHLTEEVASEIRYKMGVLSETDDLMDDYGVSEDEVMDLISSIPKEGEWEVPLEHMKMVMEECQNHADILFHQMRQAMKEGKILQAKNIGALIKEFDNLFA